MRPGRTFPSSGPNLVSAPKPYRPWLALRLRGLVLIATGGALLSASIYARSGWAMAWVAGGLASCLIGLAALKRAKARAHGQLVEAKHAPLAARQLEEAGFSTERNVKVGRGDVDIVVRNFGHIAAVEVKSFGYWRSRFRDRSRERKARDQALKQKERLQAQAAVLWLPNAQHTWLSRLLDFCFPERRITVVRGPAKRLVTHLKSLMEP